MPGLNIPRITSETTPEEFAEIVTMYNSIEGEDSLAAKMGIEYQELSFRHAVGRAPVEGNRQPAGLFHGGGHVVLAESLGSLHSALLANGQNVVGVDLNATHVRSATTGHVTARAEVLHHGRTLINHEVRMTDDEGRLLSIVRITNMVLTTKRSY